MERQSKTAVHNYFNVINTEAKAYLLGFILADGCIQQGYGVNSIRLNNSTDDIEVGELFQKEIFPGNKLCFRKNIGKKDSFNIKGSSKEIIADLAKFNVKPNKTYDINFKFNFNTLPVKFLRHFIRGFFDGDGTFTNYRFEFITTSKNFGNQIIEIIENQFNVSHHFREKQGKNLIEYMFYFNCKKDKTYKKKDFIKDLYEWFYKDSICFLKRKKSKFEMYLNAVVSSEITKGSETP